MTLENLTRRQQEVLDFIIDEIQFNGFPPTIREMCKRFDIRSSQGIVRHLEALEKKGYILRDSKARSIQITPEYQQDQGQQSPFEITSVPLLGSVAAGMPIWAEEMIEEMIPVDSQHLNSHDKHFFLRVQGDSMREAIQPDDLLLIRQQSTANPFEVIVALVEGEATVKRFVPQKDHILLVADNPDYPDIPVYNDLTIIGKVHMLTRNF